MVYFILAIASLLLAACSAPAMSDQFWWNWWPNAIVGLGTQQEPRAGWSRHLEMHGALLSWIGAQEEPKRNTGDKRADRSHRHCELQPFLESTVYVP